MVLPTNPKRLTVISIMSALATVLMLFEIPIPFLPGFKYDASEIVALITSFLLGPLSGIVVILIKDLLFFLIKGAEPIGIVMNLAMGITFVGIAGLIYSLKKTKLRAIISMIVSSVVTIIVMDALNLIVYPMYLHIDVSVIINQYLLMITIFNLGKTLIASIVTFAIYKKVSSFFKLEAFEDEIKTVNTN
ncbi:MAG TPA: ECF transporter S component [Thermotogaceae bacterium]|nr:ECF transporter S component [Thermotogaceae bacterium]